MATVFQSARAQYTLTDGNGVDAKTELWYVNPDGTTALSVIQGDVQTLQTDMAALSNCHVSESAIRLINTNFHQDGTLAVYPSATDKAILVFSAVNGQEVRMSIPAPIESIFEADGITVNAANASVAALIAFITSGKWTTNAGVALSAYVRGFRSVRQREKA